MPCSGRGSDLARSHISTYRSLRLEHTIVSCFVSDLELVKLPEDITLAGFTPLMLNPQDPCYVGKTEDMVNYVALHSLYLITVLDYKCFVVISPINVVFKTTKRERETHREVHLLKREFYLLKDTFLYIFRETLKL